MDSSQFTPQMLDEMNDNLATNGGGVIEQIQRKNKEVYFAKQEQLAKERLKRSIKKRNRNRVRNRNARKVRSNQRRMR